MHKLLASAVCLLALSLTACAQTDPCVSAGDCEQKAFAFAFTKDTNIDDVKVADAERIQSDVRKCFQPCAESARKIAKLSLAAGDNLFDTGRQKSGRARGRISEPTFGKNGNNGRGNGNARGNGRGRGNGNAPKASTPKPNTREALLARFNAGRGRGRGGGRGKRAAMNDPGQCVANVLGQSQFAYIEQCIADAGAAKNPDVQKLLQDRGITLPGTITTPNPLSFLNQVRNQFGNNAQSAFNRFGNLFGGNTGSLFGGRGKRAAGFKPQKDKQGELLYMFAYAQDIAQRVCPDKRDDVMFCVQKASQNTIDFENVNVNAVKGRYCQAKAECQKRKTQCERQRGEQEAVRCKCVNEIKAKVGRRCELAPSPCDLQSDPPRKDRSGEMCTSPIPSAAEVVELVRKRNGGDKNKIRAAKARKMASDPRRGG